MMNAVFHLPTYDKFMMLVLFHQIEINSRRCQSISHLRFHTLQYQDSKLDIWRFKKRVDIMHCHGWDTSLRMESIKLEWVDILLSHTFHILWPAQTHYYGHYCCSAALTFKHWQLYALQFYVSIWYFCSIAGLLK